jgi:G3E family GTPase
MANHSELILITGFLGAGKTTLIQSLLRLYADRRIHLIVNEFGAVSVDGVLLDHLGASMDEIVNGSVFCTCRMDQFEAALDRAQTERPDLIFVEASGLSDPTAIRTILERDNRYPGIRYRGCVALADATNLRRVIDSARVCHRQLSIADLILLTKTDIASAEQMETAEALLRKRYLNARILHAVKGAVSKETMDTLSAQHSAQPDTHGRDLTLQKYSLAVSGDMSLEKLRAFLRMFAEDTYRIKGLVRLSEGSYQVDCVGAYVKITRFDGKQIINRLAVLAGEGMPLRKSLKEAVAWYSDWVKEEPSDG